MDSKKGSSSLADVWHQRQIQRPQLGDSGLRSTLAEAHEHATNLESLSLPLVSIVVLNYNYGRFLATAVKSIYDQIYPHIECIIVDDASTDNSPQVIDEICTAHRDAIVIRRTDNGGPSVASLEGFRASRGQYVVFLDADDVLLPEFVRTHIFVYLSLRVHVGFTSSDVLQTAGDEIVVATGQAMNDHIRATAGPTRGLARSIGESLKSLSTFDNFDESVLDRLYYVAPGRAQWVWSPASANMYRRDALDLIMGARKLPALRASMDVFCCVGVSGLCGSVLIDTSLSAYRIHGTNLSTQRVQLNGISVMRADLTVDAIEILIDHLRERRMELLNNTNVRNYVTLLRNCRRIVARSPQGSTIQRICLQFLGRILS